MKGEGSQVFGSSNRTRRDKDGRREDEKCFGLANSKVYQKHSKVLGIGKLIPSIHQGFHSHSQAITQYD